MVLNFVVTGLSICIFFLFIGEGSIIDRIEHNWHVSGFMASICIIVYIVMYKLYNPAMKTIGEMKRFPVLSCNMRKIFFITGLLLFSIAVVRMIWFPIVPHAGLLQFSITFFCLLSGPAMLTNAFYDANINKYSWRMLCKRNYE